ncbi:cytidine deaminase [Aliiglaciecola sp. CAU 1673]|uniref:cytidine deaminase n=1 Tax=Aliiglaciecola sp. CAU 1673 TaxID=3032595 RepID=UPI0023D9C157|nr:cytidine deaminase [Aliiglaciecola sp. CAU 1673]MDF2177026.1 cytidine deaminase [Aliiglaciecola sp. CAU 1673]
MNQATLEKQKEYAKTAASHAYNRYSNFAVGAALSLKDGRLIPGCNVENASYGLTNCAERTAIYAAIAQGIKPEQFAAMTIYMPGDKLYSPCGACRQVIAEFFPANAKVHATCDAEHTQSWRVDELLPGLFSLP